MNTKEQYIKYMKANPPFEGENGYYKKIADMFGGSAEYVRKVAREAGIRNVRSGNTQAKRTSDIGSDPIEMDAIVSRLQGDKKKIDAKYKMLLDKLEIAEKEKKAILEMKNNTETSVIISSKSKSSSEATAFMIGSDFHVEEEVKPQTISGLNKFNLNIAEKRINAFFVNGLKLCNIVKKDIKVDNLVLALLGDFISNSIHEELMEVNLLPPVGAVIFAKNSIIPGINYLLQNSNMKLTIVCSFGNHGRITKERRHATESGNSLEFFMYHIIADHFKDEKRIKFVIGEGYHTYLDIYGKTIRFHHGHNLRYAGGIGGIFIPAYKAIAQWNKMKQADLDVFGHFHQRKDGGNFISNGSLIGYNAFALSIKADYEQPMQSFFMIDSNGRRIMNTPIFLE